MATLFQRRRFLLAAVIVGVLLAGPVVSLRADDAPQPPGLYHAEQSHLWNRLHEALFVRIGPDARRYGFDRLEPLLWNDSRQLIEGAGAERAAQVLDAFLRDQGEKLIDDPRRRAVLQRDLWLVFNWLAAAETQPTVERLRKGLAQAISRLALAPEQIARLPDNYEAAIRAKRFADHFESAEPEKPYLPPDLFRAEGTWVSVGRLQGPTAPDHLREGGTNALTNSAFFVLLKLPGGRAATLAYVQRLATFDQPLMVASPDEAGRRATPFYPNPALPPLPAGAEVALVRRALLIDSAGRIVVSPLVESVQLRVIRQQHPALTPATYNDLLVNSSRTIAHAAEYEAVFEFRLHRGDYFAPEGAGLRDVSAERDFKTGFRSHPWDEFDRARETGRPFPESGQPIASIRASCVHCHSLPGIYGFNSLQELRGGNGPGGDRLQPHALGPRSLREVEQAAIEWKQKQASWAALRKLLAP